MANDPVYITFEFRGNLEDEVEKVTLGIKGLRDESAKTYQRLIADSGAAYGAMSAENRKLAVTVQESINALRDLAVVQGSLDDGLEAGTVTTRYPIFRNVWYACGYPGFSMSTVLFFPRSCVSRISRYSLPAPSTMFSGRQFTPLA